MKVYVRYTAHNRDVDDDREFIVLATEKEIEELDDLGVTTFSFKSKTTKDDGKKTGIFVELPKQKGNWGEWWNCNAYQISFFSGRTLVKVKNL